jgi:DNA primase
MATPVEEIKEKLNIADLVGEYVRLQQRGTNYKGLCPFHNEKSPSFTVSEEKQFYHCFGCGKGGDVFQFIQDIEGVEFVEALRMLAKKTGVQLRAVNKQEENVRTRLQDIVEHATVFFQQQLNTPAAAHARAYTEKRGLTQEAIQTFRIGYAPESWDLLVKFLKSKNFTDAELQQSGMVVLGKNGSLYDRFRDRLMFPIEHTQGAVIGFTGRILKDDAKEAKYVNTPETPLYHKGSVLYGLSKSKTFIQKVGAVVLMEGQMDVVSSFQHQIRNVVASSGTALTADQVKLLKRYTQNVILAFDGDAAGVKAAWKGMQIAVQEGMNIKVMALPEGEDPADIVKRDPDVLRELGKTARPFMDYAFDQVLSKLDLTLAHNKKTAAQELLPMIALFPDQIEQTHYIHQLSNTLGVEDAVLAEKIRTFRASQQMSTARAVNNRPGQGSAATASSTDETATADHPQDPETPYQGRIDQLLALMIKYPAVVTPRAIEYFPAELRLGSLESQQLYKSLLNQYTQQSTNELQQPSDLSNHTADSYRARIEMLAQEWYARLDDRQLEKELMTLLVSLKRHAIQSRLRSLRQELVNAEREQQAELITRYTTELSQLTVMLHQLS